MEVFDVFKYKKYKYLIRLHKFGFNWYVTRHRKYIIIYFNSGLSNRERSDLLHKIIRENT